MISTRIFILSMLIAICNAQQQLVVAWWKNICLRDNTPSLCHEICFNAVNQSSTQCLPDFSVLSKSQFVVNNDTCINSTATYDPYPFIPGSITQLTVVNSTSDQPRVCSSNSLIPPNAGSQRFYLGRLPAGRSVSEWIRNSTKPNVDFEFIEDGTPIACRYPTPWSGCQNFINTNSCAGFIERMDKIYWKSPFYALMRRQDNYSYPLCIEFASGEYSLVPPTPSPKPSPPPTSQSESESDSSQSSANSILYFFGLIFSILLFLL